MDRPPEDRITAMLLELGAADGEPALARLLPLVYAELHSMAERRTAP